MTPAGELDEGGLQTLMDMGDWMEVNGEGLYNSYAWRVWGEGSVVMESGNLVKKHADTPYTGKDIRFTVKDHHLYAYLMAWPKDNKVIINSLTNKNEKVKSVELLGCKKKLKWKQTAQGLEVELPDNRPCDFAYGLKIKGNF